MLRRRLAPVVMLSLVFGGLPSAAAQLPIPGPTLPTPLPALPGTELAPEPRGAAPPPTDCTVEGDDGPDQLIGTPGPDVICGNGGDDILEGLEGDDVLDGGDGSDTASWASSVCCVRANLEMGLASGALGTDQLSAIEHLAGSQGTDLLRGSAAANTVAGNGGIDLLFGGDGDDWLTGGDGDDWLAGETGANILDGGTGANICADGAGSFCEPPDPGDPPDGRGPLDISLVDAQPTGDTTSWRIGIRKRVSASRLWDEGYVVVSFDTRGGEEFEVHALIRWNKRKPIGLLIPEGGRSASGKLDVQGSGAAFAVRVPLGRLGIDPSRLYYRWSARTLFTGSGCKPCIDSVPDARAYPQPLVNA